MMRNLRAGITLLETMIALAVMALIAVTLGAGFGSSTQLLNSSIDVTAAVDQAVVRRDFRRWLGQALVFAFPGQSDGGLSGEADQLRFSFASADGAFWAGDPVVVTVSLDANNSVVLVAQGSADAPGKRAIRSQIIAGPDAKLKIAYFGRLRPEDPIAWIDHWTSEAGLPDLIRFTLSTPEANIPPISIRPGKSVVHSEMSLSSLLPPFLPSRP